MAAARFTANVRERTAVPVIDLRGEIDAAAEEALDAAYSEASERNSSAILLNFAGVDYINSTGIALIVAVLARARRDHRQVTAYGLSDHYREIFQITRLADFMRMYPDEASAIAAAPASSS